VPELRQTDSGDSGCKFGAGRCRADSTDLATAARRSASARFATARLEADLAAPAHWSAPTDGTRSGCRPGKELVRETQDSQLSTYRRARREHTAGSNRRAAAAFHKCRVAQRRRFRHVTRFRVQLISSSDYSTDSGHVYEADELPDEGDVIRVTPAHSAPHVGLSGETTARVLSVQPAADVPITAEERTGSFHLPS